LNRIYQENLLATEITEDTEERKDEPGKTLLYAEYLIVSSFRNEIFSVPSVPSVAEFLI
jgi:hypothetical protein